VSALLKTFQKHDTIIKIFFIRFGSFAKELGLAESAVCRQLPAVY
jgi:hypothetical protein